MESKQWSCEDLMGYKRVVISEFGGPEVLKVIEEKNLPEPGNGEVRIKVLATSAAFTDTLIRKGIFPEVKRKPPFSPGYDMVGIVDKLGENTTKLKIGQKVAELTVIGAYSEYICLPEDRLVPVPDELDAAEAVSLVLSYVTAYQMLYRSLPGFAMVKVCLFMVPEEQLAQLFYSLGN